MPDLAPRDAALQFVRSETQFHLGVLPTEQSHPATREFSRVIASDVEAGVRLLSAVDDDVPTMARRVLRGEEAGRLRVAISRALHGEGRLFISGCGATGRLAILLEAAWRRCFRGSPSLAGRVVSIMTGGDRALIRSIEGFEDYQSFGREQLAAAGAGPGDVLLAISEGGETSSVIGSIWEALDRGAEVCYAFNNPADLLCAHVERSREVIQEPRVLVLDLTTGPMAVAGSTRMQAVTAELLVLGAVLESVASELLGASAEPLGTSVERFEALLEALREPAAVEAVAGLIALEEGVYRQAGLVTYLTSDHLLDILTDTTERAPTFSLPPFRPRGELQAEPSWAYVADPTRTNDEAWREVLGRPPRGLDWPPETYRRLGADEALVAKSPALSAGDLLAFEIGERIDPERLHRPGSRLMVVQTGGPAEPVWQAARAGAHQGAEVVGLVLGPVAPEVPEPLFQIPLRLRQTPLRLPAHLALKLVFNTLSTGTMARLGRIEGNWMMYVETTNKKLVDRSTRLLVELGGVDYETACIALHETLAELRRRPSTDRPVPPVVLTLERLRKQRAG